MDAPLAVADGVDGDHRRGLAGRPVGEGGCRATIGMEQPDRAVGEIVFGVDYVEEVLAEQPDGPSSELIVHRDELHPLECVVQDGEVFGLHQATGELAGRPLKDEAAGQLAHAQMQRLDLAA